MKLLYIGIAGILLALAFYIIANNIVKSQANASWAIAQPSPTPVPAPTHFSTLAYGVTPPTESQCTGLVNAFPISEAVAANTPFNIPPSSIPASFYTNPTPAKGDSQSISDFAKVDGSYTGTTDDIIRWGACKYGIDENVVRAQAWVESGWQQGGFGDKKTTQASCVNGSFTALWNTSITEPGGTVVSCPNCCYQSWSAWQTKVYYNYTTWPWIMQSTPAAVDYRYADQRSCMNGDYSIYFSSSAQQPNTYATDIASYKAGTDTTGRVLWGCIGVHFSGSWYDSGAQTYISEVQAALASQPWP